MSRQNTNFLKIVAEEQKLVALEYQNEAWIGGMLNGIDPKILASAAFDTALRHLLKTQSEASALDLLRQMHDKVIMGEFSAHKTLQ
ncbi:hypothetical protein [Bartonella sp. DGB2]|uniref:hypothetical protein n=1 Tax=Bartonella sp. DGB2 TaxID=3388426 RepID=UPI00398F982D